MKLSADSARILKECNAGGTSQASEALSLELFRKCFNAKLLKTEMEVVYFPEGGSLTDYVIKLFNRIIGVSVTRAMKYDGSEFTPEEGRHLLEKKLRGIRQSSRNSTIKWDKQILHVWTMTEETALTVISSWIDIDDDQLKSNTAVIITVVSSSSSEVFFEKKQIN